MKGKKYVDERDNTDSSAILKQGTCSCRAGCDALSTPDNDYNEHFTSKQRAESGLLFTRVFHRRRKQPVNAR